MLFIRSPSVCVHLFKKFAILFFRPEVSEVSTHISVPIHFSPEQDMFRESVRKFMRDELAVDHARFEKQGKVDKETWKKLGSQGKIVFLAQEVT